MLKTLSFLIYILCGLWGLAVCFQIVSDVLGTGWAIVSLFLAPFLLGLAPWYQLFVNGDWFALAVVYGGGLAATILHAIGSAISGERKSTV